MPMQRAYAAGNFALLLDGKPSGLLRSVSGGDASAEVITELGHDRFAQKNIGSIKYEDIICEVGFTTAKPLWDWIIESWKGTYQRKDGSILFCDFKMDIQSERTFSQALITETRFPTLDGSSKQGAFVTVKMSPEAARVKKGSGKADPGTVSKDAAKMFLPSNFRLDIGGLECKRVSKIDSFSVKQSIAVEAIGDGRDYRKEPGQIEFPNLKITFAEVDAQSWRDWFQKFVLDGNSSPEMEKQGTLKFLSSNLRDELAEIELLNLGIFRLYEEPRVAGKEGIQSVTAELYCEQMRFHPLAAK